MAGHVTVAQGCQGRIRLCTGKHFFTVTGLSAGRFPSKVVGVLCLSGFKRHLDSALLNVLKFWLALRLSSS